MSTTGASVILTPGQQAIIRPTDPAAQTSAVVLQNLSPYDLAVSYAGQQYSLPAYTADLYSSAQIGVPIIVVPSNPNGTTGVVGYVIPVWYSPGEDPTDQGAQAYPATMSPPPVAVGLAVAEQLLISGIPNVLTTTVIGDFALPGGSAAVAIDVHGYASVLLIMTDTPVSQPVAVNYQFTDVAQTAVVQPGEWAQQGGAPVPLTLPVVGPTLILSQAALDTNPPHTIRVIGSNRPAPRGHADALGYTPAGFESTFSGSLVSGTPVNVMFFNQPTKGVVFAGPAIVEFVMQATITPAHFTFEWQTSEGLIDMDVADTGETGWHPIGQSGGLAGITKQLAIPNGRLTVKMTPGITTGGAVVTMRAFPAY